MKKFLLILFSLLVVGYLIFSFFYFGNSSGNLVCNRFEVVVKDSQQVRFVQSQDIENLVKRFKLYPVGKKIKDINTLAIKDSILANNRLVESAEVYTAHNGDVIANIYQRKPVLRIISENKRSYYIDSNREKMPISGNFTVYVPLATGVVDEEFARTRLSDFAEFLNENPKWDAWFEQIVVKPGNEIELVPRMGDFRIILGQLDNYPEKLDKFLLFAEEGLNKIGWNRYSTINLKYDKQVVCTKK